MKIKPNTLFKKCGRFSQTHLGNTEIHNFWLFGLASQMSQEWRVKRRRSRQNLGCKVSSNPRAGHPESPARSPQGQTGTGRVGAYTVRAPVMAGCRTTASLAAVPAAGGRICPCEPFPSGWRGARGARADTPGRGQAWQRVVGALPSPESRRDLRLFADLLVTDQRFFGWCFCFLSNHMLSSEDAQQVSHAWFKALTPRCFASWRVEIHNFH